MMRMMCGVKLIDSVSSDLVETMSVFVVKIEYMLIHSCWRLYGHVIRRDTMPKCWWEKVVQGQRGKIV